MFSPAAYCPTLAGLIILALGLIFFRKEFAAASGLDKIIALASAFYAAPLAAFGAEHFTAVRVIAQLVPSWIPGHLFWACFVGASLLAAALSFTFRKLVRISAPLIAAMFFIFGFTMDIPGAVSAPHNRFFWALVARESCFAAGALALTATTHRQACPRLANVLTAIARIIFALSLLYYGPVQILHPANAPGVPLEKLNPAWVPIPHFWPLLVGAILLIAGIALLLNRRARFAAALVGLVITLLTIVLYAPIWITSRGTAEIVDGLNYFFDTLLFAGAILLLAAALPREVQSKPQS